MFAIYAAGSFKILIVTKRGRTNLNVKYMWSSIGRYGPKIGRFFYLNNVKRNFGNITFM